MFSKIAVSLASLVMVASPCAAQMHAFEEAGAFRGGAAVGAYFRLPFGREAGQPARAQIGLRVTAIRDHRDYRAPTGPVHQTDALDLRLLGKSKPTLLIAGRSMADLPAQRLNLGTGETIAIVAGGAAVLLLLAVVAAGPGFPDCPAFEGNTDHCID